MIPIKKIRRITMTGPDGKKTVLEGEELKDSMADADKRRLEREYLRTHPPDVERISGCCDPAE